MTFIYEVKNLVPCREGGYNGHPFTREMNALLGRNTQAPIPLLVEHDQAHVVGYLTYLQQDSDGSLSAHIVSKEPANDRRVSIAVMHAADEEYDYLQNIAWTTTPDPCGDEQDIILLKDEYGL